MLNRAPGGLERLARRQCSALAVLACLFGACERGESRPVPAVQASEALPGGATSVAFAPVPSFELPASNLGPEGRPDFHAGKALAHQPWVKAPSSTDARDGLGPLYSARSCLACHISGGRGRVSFEDGPLSAATLVRVSVPGMNEQGGVVPEPTYGAQLQPRSIALGDQLSRAAAPTDAAGKAAGAEAAPEATIDVRWTERTFRYPDGKEVVLRKPAPVLKDLGYGPLHPKARLGLRHTPPLHGLGLLALIPDEVLAGRADPDDRDADGISGRQNQVWDPLEARTRPGRFGLKANQPTLKVQVAGALHGDIGITSSVFPALPCTAKQPACQSAAHGAKPGQPEISDKLLDLMVTFVRSIGVPRRRKPDAPLVQRGRALFHRSGCADCHTPGYVTGKDETAPHLSEQPIWPYTDLLLHDMGGELADGRSDFLASGNEWRTPPLWGVGLARAVRKDAGLLHDGRASTVEQAVLWHAGEATSSRERFARLNAEDRRALLSFVRSL